MYLVKLSNNFFDYFMGGASKVKSKAKIFPDTHTCSGPLWRARRQRGGRDGQHAAQWERVQHRGDGRDADLRLRPHHVQPGQVGLSLQTKWVEKIHLYSLAMAK